MNAKRILTGLIFLTLIIAGVSGRMAAADSDGRFGLRSLKGEWGFLAFGSIGDVPAAGIGRLIFDGSGLCSNVATLNFGGALVPLDTTLPNGHCSYMVNSDGTGRIVQTFIDPTGEGPFGENPASFDVTLIIVDGGNEFRFIVDDPGMITVGNGVAKRQRGNDD